MNKFKEKISRFIPSKRKLMQLYFALLFNANLKGFIKGDIYKGATKNMCIPGLNCYSCPGAVGACPLGSLQGSFSADKSTLFYVGGILLIFSIMFGRMICGWLCPFGLIQELLYKFKTPKLKKNRITKILSYFKYVILVVFVFIIPIAYAFKDTPFPAFCKFICPAGTIEGGVGLLANKLNEGYFSMLGPLFTWKFALMVSVLVACVFIFRMFCRFMCPLGALYGLFNKFSFFGIKLEEPKCINCNLCIKHCQMDIHHVGDMECISCGECIDVCPTKAISFKGGKFFVKENEIPAQTQVDESSEPKQSESKTDNLKTKRYTTRIISAILLISILLGAFIYFWNDESGVTQLPLNSDSSDESTPENSDIPDVPQGNQVGNLCYGADLSIITSEGISQETVNPIKTGKITIINFWGTWCTPCVKELPYFGQIATEYKDNVSVIAIHTDMVSDTAPEYIKNHYPQSDLIFAKDLADEAYYNALGGRGTYPYTVILDNRGVITHVFLNPLEYEDLKQAIEEILAK